mmetsp:Transcript_253/g.858  ORF Transcript_253/g.858 Transcript_253/m.858 type:complete len:248 (+) Transcript_253:4100-4843(+)
MISSNSYYHLLWNVLATNCADPLLTMVAICCLLLLLLLLVAVVDYGASAPAMRVSSLSPLFPSRETICASAAIPSLYPCLLLILSTPDFSFYSSCSLSNFRLLLFSFVACPYLASRRLHRPPARVCVPPASEIHRTSCVSLNQYHPKALILKLSICGTLLLPKYSKQARRVRLRASGSQTLVPTRSDTVPILYPSTLSWSFARLRTLPLIVTTQTPRIVLYSGTYLVPFVSNSLLCLHFPSASKCLA